VVRHWEKRNLSCSRLLSFFIMRTVAQWSFTLHVGGRTVRQTVHIAHLWRATADSRSHTLGVVMRSVSVRTCVRISFPNVLTERIYFWPPGVHFWSVHIATIVENSTVDANTVKFYATTTLWCPSLNLVVVRHGTQPWIQSETLWYHYPNSIHSLYQNVLLPGSDWDIMSRSVPQQSSFTSVFCTCKPYFDISNRLGVAHKCEGQKDGRRNCALDAPNYRFGDVV